MFWDKNPARFARFRRNRNDTADTALDAIGTPCNDRYSVTSFLTGVRVPLGVPAESIFGGVVSGAGKHLVSRCFFSPCLGTRTPRALRSFGTAEMTLRTPHWTRSALRATIAIPSLRSLPRYNPKQKGHCPPQHTPSEHLLHHNILCFFFPRIFLAVSPFPDLTAKYSQSRFRALFPRLSPPFELPVSAPLLRGFYSRKSASNNDSPIDFLTAIY